MNPPFSRSPGTKGKRDLQSGGRHVLAALETLKPGGRLVAIVGGGLEISDRPKAGMSMTSKTYQAFWNQVREQGNVRANIHVGGKVYSTMGTDFATRVIVIDKAPEGAEPVQGDIVTAEVDSLEGLIDVADGIREIAAPETETQPEAEPESALPADLRGAKPRYGYREANFQLNFEADVDKALFIAAQTKKSKRDADYRKFLRQWATDERIDELGPQVRDEIKSIAKAAYDDGERDGTLEIPGIVTVEDLRKQPEQGEDTDETRPTSPDEETQKDEDDGGSDDTESDETGEGEGTGEGTTESSGDEAPDKGGDDSQPDSGTDTDDEGDGSEMGDDRQDERGGTDDDGDDGGTGGDDGAPDGSDDVGGTEGSADVPDKKRRRPASGGTAGGTSGGGTGSGTSGGTTGGQPSGDTTGDGTGDGSSDIDETQEPDEGDKKPGEKKPKKPAPATKPTITEATVDQLEQPYVPDAAVLEMFPDAQPHPADLVVPTAFMDQDEATGKLKMPMVSLNQYRDE